jgi:hypothetical protein
MTLIVFALIFMAYRGSYLAVERIAIAVGAFEFVFLFVAWQAHPELTALASGTVDIAWSEPKYLYLVAANIGAVIMPWMVFYQQSSVVEKKLTPDDLPAARLDTAFGAVVTQIIMAAVLVATAATLGTATQHGSLDTVQQISQAIIPYLGKTTGKLLFGLGLSGAAVVATKIERRRAGDECSAFTNRTGLFVSVGPTASKALSIARSLCGPCCGRHCVNSHLRAVFRTFGLVGLNGTPSTLKSPELILGIGDDSELFRTCSMFSVSQNVPSLSVKGRPARLCSRQVNVNARHL